MELLELPFEPASASIARRHVVHVLRTRGVDAVACEDAALIVSELVGNSLRHATPTRGGTLTVGWRFGDDVLRIEVTDGGSRTRPALRRVDELASSGRGLEIIAALSCAWGYATETQGTTVWADLLTGSMTRAGNPLGGLDPQEYDETG